MKIPLHILISQLNKMNLDDQCEKLVALVADEKPYSVRRNELLSLLQGKRTKQINRNNRRAKRAA